MPRAARATTPTDGADRTPLRRELVEAEIMEQAATLFAARGFAATSMQDIADALGTSRPGLYHYFPNKDEILARLVADLGTETQRVLAEALAIDGTADVRLAGLVRALIVPIAHAPSRFRLVLTSDAAQTPADSPFASLRHEVYEALHAVLGEGMASGVFRRCDPTVTTFTILGMINWVAWWYHADRGPATGDLTDAVTDLALASVRADRSAPGGNTPADIIASLRRDLDFLERAVG
jgi:AcrR family transcriptional regulator